MALTEQRITPKGWGDWYGLPREYKASALAQLAIGTLTPGNPNYRPDLSRDYKDLALWIAPGAQTAAAIRRRSAKRLAEILAPKLPRDFPRSHYWPPDHQLDFYSL